MSREKFEPGVRGGYQIPPEIVAAAEQAGRLAPLWYVGTLSRAVARPLIEMVPFTSEGWESLIASGATFPDRPRVTGPSGEHPGPALVALKQARDA